MLQPERHSARNLISGMVAPRHTDIRCHISNHDSSNLSGREKRDKGKDGTKDILTSATLSTRFGITPYSVITPVSSWRMEARPIPFLPSQDSIHTSLSLSTYTYTYTHQISKWVYPSVDYYKASLARRRCVSSIPMTEGKKVECFRGI